MPEQTFSEWLAAEAESHGLQGKEIAALANIDAGSISRLRNGKQRPTTDQVFALRRIFDGSHRATLAIERLRKTATLPMAGTSAAMAPRVGRRSGTETRETIVAPAASSTPVGRVVVR